MKIKVNQHDIDHGIKCDCNRCAIALAIRRKCKADNVFVQYSPEDGSVYGIVDGERFDFKDMNLALWIQSLDRGNKVNPIEFDLRF